MRGPVLGKGEFDHALEDLSLNQQSPRELRAFTTMLHPTQHAQTASCPIFSRRSGSLYSNPRFIAEMDANSSLWTSAGPMYKKPQLSNMLTASGGALSSRPCRGAAEMRSKPMVHVLGPGTRLTHPAPSAIYSWFQQAKRCSIRSVCGTTRGKSFGCTEINVPSPRWNRSVSPCSSWTSLGLTLIGWGAAHSCFTLAMTVAA